MLFFVTNIMKKHFHYRFAVAHEKAPIRNALTHRSKNKFTIFIPHNFSLKIFLCGSTVDFPRSFSSFETEKSGRREEKKKLFSHMRKIASYFFINSHINRC